MLQPRGFERRLTAAGVVSVVAVVVFFGALAYWTVFRGDLGERADNPRVVAAITDPSRGRILDREGNVLAESNPDGTRVYRDLSLAHVLGYLSPTYGSQGSELAFNDWLAGKAGGSWSAALDAEFARRGNSGIDVRLTIDPVIQAAAAGSLAGRAGAVVAIDPRNGEVLAMVSNPGFDPGQIEALGEALNNDPATPLVNRATQGLYPPGSTFKTVTASAALDDNVIEPETLVTCPGEIVFDGFPVRCDNVPQGIGTYPFKDAYTFSVNAIFGQVGVDTGWNRLLDMASAFGFGRALDFTLDTAPTSVVGPESELSEALLASTAFGQGEILTTPLQMALVAAAIANDGVAPVPTLGFGAYKDGEQVERFGGQGSHRVMSSETAATMRDFMLSVIEAGQAAGVAIPGVQVGGKTGTAESGVEGLSHAWFIAIAPVDDSSIAVAVVVEFGGQGSQVAAPIAGDVIRAALGQ